MKKLLLVGALVAATAAAFAFPALPGWTGGLEVPTAAVQTGWAISADNATEANPVIPQINVLGGILPNLEVGAGFGKPNDDVKEWDINAKYALPFALLGGQTAVGARYGTSDNDVDDVSELEAYLAATFAYWGMDVTLAALYIDSDAVDYAKLSPQIAVAKSFENGASIGAEAIFNAAVDDYANVYAIFPLSDAVSARLAWQGINSDAGTSTILGVAYAFGAAE